MTALIKRYKTKIQCDAITMRREANILLKLLGYEDFALGILLTNNAVMQTYNKQYRKKDMPTDILSFPFHEGLKDGSRIEACCDEDKNLGDLIISLEYVTSDAPKWHETFTQRLQTLLVHGICHLLGYDHEIEKDYEVMQKEEKRLLTALGRYEK